MAEPLRTPTWSHRVEYVATRLAVGILRLVGWRTASAAGALLGRLAYKPLGIRAGVTERQIAAAFPALGVEAVRHTSSASFASIGRTFVETSVMAGSTRDELLALFDPAVGWEYVEAAMAQDRGAIIVTGHLGNWEMGGAYLAARGVPLDVVARGMANPLMDEYVRTTRSAIGMEVVHDSQAVRQTPRSLREKRVVAMVSDHDALGLASTFVPFFGRPAKTPRGPAVFALRLGVPLLFMVAVRGTSGRYVLHVEPIPVHDTADREADVDAIVLTYTQMLERYVRLYPEQYFWQHRRWRRQPDHTPAHLREP